MKPKMVPITVLALLALGGPAPVLAQEQNAGFVQGLWYDRDTLLVGEPVRIYAAIRNNTGGDLSGTVEFYVNDDRIERNSVAALNNRIIESWADWTPSYGTSTIKATLSRTEISSSASGTRNVTVVSALTEDVIFVDRDTDGDSIGNATDHDDDGDGVSDAKEREQGTDPLDPNDPGNPEEENEGEETDSVPAEAEETDAAGHSAPAGLERYLADSRAKQTLSAITNVIDDTRGNLNAYRQARNDRNDETTENDDAGTPTEESGATSSETSLGTSSASGTGSFGEVHRSAPQEPSPSFWVSAGNGIVYLFDQVYTFLLFLLSLFLWHPMIVQLSLLVLILYLIYLAARKFGKRPG